MKTDDSRAARRDQTLRLRALSLSLCAGLALSGCAQNPLTRSDSDLGRRVATGQLRTIQAFEPDDYVAPRPEAQQEPTEDDDGIDWTSRIEGRESVEFDLAEVRAAVLQNNLDLRVALLSPTQANARLSREEAAFDQVFTLNAQWSNNDAPVINSTQSGESLFQSINPGVRVPLRSGGTAEFTLPTTRTRTDNQFATLDPSYNTEVQFSFSQPLLRGAGRRANTHSIRLAAYDQQISEAQTKLEVIRQVANADRAYWLLYGARAQLEVRQQQLELAQEQLDRAERQERAGRASEVEVIRAQAGVADRLEQIIVAENEVLRQQRQLKELMNIDGLDIATRTLVVPETVPDPVEYEFNTAALTASAVSQRMELLELELRIASDASTIDFNRNQALPLVTLDYTYRWRGLGGVYNDAVDSLGQYQFISHIFGLNAEVPISNEAAKSAVREAILARLARLGTREARELSIRREVLDAVDQLEATWQRIIAARQSVLLNARTLLAEEREFNVGRSTSTDVLDASANLADAQSAEVRALVDYQIAQVDLAFATGTLLGASRVTWAPTDPEEAEADGADLPWGLEVREPLEPTTLRFWEEEPAGGSEGE
ncbi:MAG: TolC family protein [Planctomycetota bacterium]